MNTIYKNKKGFSLVELIVVISIIIILSVIGLVSYTNTLLDARNSVRISNMSTLKMSLKNHKFKNGGYPIPGSFFNITNSGTIIQQGFINDSLSSQEITKKPTDPFLKTTYYTYSITNNKLFFQIAMSLENIQVENMDNEMIAYVDGDYQQTADFVPSIVFAAGGDETITNLSDSFIVDKGTFNYPYDIEGVITQTATGISELTSEEGVVIPKFYGYYSCLEIYENGHSMGSGSYTILQSDGMTTSTGCSMNY